MVTSSSQREWRRAFQSLARIGGAVLLSAFAAGCEKTVAPVSAIVLRNATQDSIGYYAVELRASALFDGPVFAIADSNFRGRTVAPGSDLVVKPTSIDAYFSGADIRFYLYRIRAGKALIGGAITYTNAELLSSNGVIVISASALTNVVNSSVSQGTAELFTPLDSTALIGTRVRTAYSRVRKRGWVRGIHIVKLAGDANALPAMAPRVTVSGGSGRQTVFCGDRVTSLAGSTFARHGSLKGSASGSADLVAISSGSLGTVVAL